MRRRRRRPRKRAIKKFKPNLHYMHEWEEGMVMTDCAEVGRISIHTLDRQVPGRYNRINLAKTLIRLARKGRLVRGRQERIGFGPRATVYRLPDATQKREAA